MVGYAILLVLVMIIIFRIIMLHKQKKISDEKTRFFVNTAHDIRTPLTLIKAPLEEDTVVNLGFDKALLYKNMVAADADWLYELEEWNDIFDEETRKKLYKEQKSSTTIVKEAKIYPNDPCPCGSGKKYKKCCGKNK